MNEDLKSGFKFLSQYIKNISFENPEVPQKLPHMIGKPEINVGVNVNAITIDRESNIFEIEINTKVEAIKDSEISFLTDLTPFVSHAAFVICNFSSGLSTFPVINILPSKTFVLIDKRYFLSFTNSLAIKFFSIILSSI